MMSAIEIYQDHLNLVTEAIWAERYDDVTAQMLFPVRLTVKDGHVLASTPAEMVGWARDFRTSLRDLGAAAYHRLAIAAAFTGEDDTGIDGFHRVFILHGATHLVPPYSSNASMVRVGDGWRGTGVRADIRRSRPASPARPTET